MTTVLCRISSRLKWYKKYKNRLRFDKITGSWKVGTFLRHSVEPFIMLSWQSKNIVFFSFRARHCSIIFRSPAYWYVPPTDPLPGLCSWTLLTNPVTLKSWIRRSSSNNDSNNDSDNDSDNDNNNDTREYVYCDVITAESLRDFTRFICR